MADSLELIIEPRVEGSTVQTATSSARNLEASMNNAETASSRLNNRLRRTNGRQIDQAATSTDRLGNEFEQATGGARRFNNEVNHSREATASLSSQVKKLAGTYLSLSAAKKATETFIAFQDTMLKVKSLVGDVTDNEFTALENQAKKLGATTAFSASQVAKAQANFAQSGFSVNEILSSTPGTLALASAATLEMGRASEIVSKSLNLFNLNASESGRVADVIAKAQASSAADASFLATALFNVGSAANSMGFNIEDTVALTSAIATGFDNGSSAGTALNATLRDMAKNSGALQKLGVATTNADGSFRQLEDIMLDLKSATDSMTDSQKKQTLASIFGDEAQRAVNILLTQGAEKTKEYDKILRNSAGTATSMAQVMESGLGGTLRSLLSATEGVALGFLTFLNPVLTATGNVIIGVLSIGNKFLNFMNSGSLLADILTSAVWGITAAFAAYKIQAGISFVASQLVASGLTITSLATGGLTAAMNLLNLSNPLGWIAIGVTGLTLLYKKFKPFRELIQKITGGLKKLFGGKDTTATIDVNENKSVNANLSNTLGNSKLNTNTINNINNRTNNTNQSGNIVIPVSNNVDSTKLAKEIEKNARKTVEEYNRQQIARIGG